MAPSGEYVGNFDYIHGADVDIANATRHIKADYGKHDVIHKTGST